jgi:hypothetical protein
MRIYINGRGKTYTDGDDVYQDFHIAHLNSDGKLSVSSSTGYVVAPIDLKITLFVASPCGVGVTEVEELK